MGFETLFAAELSRFKTLLIVDQVKRILISAMLLYFALITVLFGMKGLGLFRLQGFAVYMLFFLLALSVSILNVVRTKKSMAGELLKVDRQFDLRELLSTSYEILEQGGKSIFANILIRDAANFLASIKPSQIFPKYFTLTHLFSLITIIIVFNLLSIYFTYFKDTPKSLPDTPLKNITEQIESHAEKRLLKPEDPENEILMNLYEEMMRLTDKIKDLPEESKDFLRSLEGLKEKAETERSRITQDLEKELNSNSTSALPFLNPLHKDMEEAELEQLRNTISQLFTGDIPQDLSEDLERLKRLHKLELSLDKTIESLNSNISEGSPLSGVENQENNLDRPELNNSEDSGGKVIPGKNMDFPGPQVRMPQMEGPKKPATIDSKPDDLESTGDKTTSAGYGHDDAGSTAEEEPEGLKSPVVRDGNNSDQGTRYSLQVMSLPLSAKADMEEEEILRSYRTEVESVLNKEEIPANYRQYIKDYFLSIGIAEQ